MSEQDNNRLAVETKRTTAPTDACSTLLSNPALTSLIEPPPIFLERQRMSRGRSRASKHR